LWVERRGWRPFIPETAKSEKRLKDYMRFKDPMAATTSMKITVVWDEMLCTLVDYYQNFQVKKIHTAEESS
jgi:hypothetical protein